jgi:hypothetical protein
VSGPQSGRRPELLDETRNDERRETRTGRGDLSARGGPAGKDERDEMKSENAGAPVAVEEGRCASCGEEIQPVPT